MGGQFWSVYVDCEDAVGIDDPTVSPSLWRKIWIYTNERLVGRSRYSWANWYYKTFHRGISICLPILW
jgi:hypothetical protein